MGARENMIDLNALLSSYPVLDVKEEDLDEIVFRPNEPLAIKVWYRMFVEKAKIARMKVSKIVKGRFCSDHWCCICDLTFDNPDVVLSCNGKPYTETTIPFFATVFSAFEVDRECTATFTGYVLCETITMRRDVFFGNTFIDLGIPYPLTSEEPENDLTLKARQES